MSPNCVCVCVFFFFFFNGYIQFDIMQLAHIKYTNFMYVHNNRNKMTGKNARN